MPSRGFPCSYYPVPTTAGIAHPGLLLNDAAGAIKFSLPALPFTILMPALSLLLVFRSNNGYSRWNEARPIPSPYPHPQMPLLRERGAYAMGLQWLPCIEAVT